jgi:hypothetical protein
MLGVGAAGGGTKEYGDGRRGEGWGGRGGGEITGYPPRAVYASRADGVASGVGGGGGGGGGGRRARMGGEEGVGVAFSTQDQIPYTHTRQLQEAYNGQDLLVHAGQAHVPVNTDPSYMKPQPYAVYQGVQAVGAGGGEGGTGVQAVGKTGVGQGRGGGGGRRGIVYDRQTHAYQTHAYLLATQFC